MFYFIIVDVDGVTHVVNYDFPQTAEDYVHRIGRTGRSENKGASYTMMTKDDDRHAKSLVALLQEANQVIYIFLRHLVNFYLLSVNSLLVASR